MNGSLPRRYARALIEIGKEEKLVDRFGQELDSLMGIIHENSEIFSVLKNDLFPISERMGAMDEISDKSGFHELLKSFLLLLIKKDRLELLPDIVREYGRYRDAALGILRTIVVTPKKTDTLLLRQIETILSDRLKRQVISHGETRPDMIGGIILKIDHTTYDGSIRRELDSIKEDMMKG